MKKLINFLIIACLLFTIPTMQVYATETEDDGYILGVDENGNTILIDPSEIEDEPIINPDDPTSGEFGGDITIDDNIGTDEKLESEPGFSIQIDEDINKEDEKEPAIDLDKVTPIVGELDEEIEYPDEIDQGMNISPIAILGIIASVFVIIIVIVFIITSKKKK